MDAVRVCTTKRYAHNFYQTQRVFGHHYIYKKQGRVRENREHYYLLMMICYKSLVADKKLINPCNKKRLIKLNEAGFGRACAILGKTPFYKYKFGAIEIVQSLKRITAWH